jgi:hypothetical protein
MTADFTYVKPEHIRMETHASLDTRWLEKIVLDDPAVLGLGHVTPRGSGAVWATSNRLELLLHDPRKNIQYEIVMQLGCSSEDHISRVIELYLAQQRRHPAWRHVAVVAAEELTQQSFRDFDLYEPPIPVVLLQMSVVKLDNLVTLVSTVVVDRRST